MGNELSQTRRSSADRTCRPAEIQKAASEAGLPDTIDLPTCDVVDESIDSGSKALLCENMRIHALEATGGLTYAQMGRFQSSAIPDDPAEPATDRRSQGRQRQPISNGARKLWLTETALATALNVSYMAEQLSIFSIVVGIALVLTGIGSRFLRWRCFWQKTARELRAVLMALHPRRYSEHCDEGEVDRAESQICAWRIKVTTAGPGRG